MKTLIKIAVFLLTLLLLLIVSGYYAFFHSSLPAKVGTYFIEKSDKSWSFDGVSGSISDGFSITSLTYTDPDDRSKKSTINNIGFAYKKSNDAITITKIYLDSASLYINPKQEFEENGTYTREVETIDDDSFEENKNSSDEDEIRRKEVERITGNSVKNNENHRNSKNNEVLKKDESSFFEDLLHKKWIFKNIDFKNITIIDPVTNKKTYIKQFHSDGFTIHDGNFSMGKITIESNNLKLDITPAGNVNELEMSSEFIVESSVKKDLYHKFKNDFDIYAEIDFLDGRMRVNSFAGFARSIIMRSETGDKKKVSLNEFTFNDYFKYDDVPPIKKLNLEGIYNLKNGKNVGFEVKRGDFRLGDARFKLDKAIIDLTDPSSPDNKLVAHSTYRGVKYTVVMTDNNKIQLDFTSNPKMSEKEILSNLLYRNKFSKITKEELEIIKKYLKQ